MQNATIDIEFIALVLFLLGVVARARPDDRTKCWFAAWSCLLVSYLAQVFQFHEPLWNNLSSTIAGVTQAMSATFFVLAGIVLTRGRRFSAMLWAAIVIPSAICIGLAELDVRNVSWLVVAVIVRLGLLLSRQRTIWRERPGFSVAVLVVSTISTCSMAYAAVHREPGILVSMLLWEGYTVAGIDLLNKNVERTIGKYVVSAGLLLWGLSIPISTIAQAIDPSVRIDSPLWSPPKAMVATGIILMLVEEEFGKVRSLAREYELIFDKNPHPLWIFEVETLRFVSVNESACAVHGYTNEEFLQLTLLDVLHPSIRERVAVEARDHLPHPNRASRHIRKDGVEVPMDIAVHNVVFQGKPCRFVLGLDVTKRNNLERRLEFQRGHDALTGLANRTLCEQNLADAISRAIQSEEKLAIVRLDVYGFQHLIQAYGVRIGDHCVEYVAAILNGVGGASDMVARTGDDAFAIVLTGLKDATRAEMIARDLLERFKNVSLIDGYEIQLSCDVGIAVCPDDGTDPMALWHLAEGALSRAKAQGANEIIWSSTDQRNDAEMRAELALSLKRRLENGEVSLVYQPLYGLDGRIHCLEALLRMQHPNYGAINPLTVINMAEETGLIEVLGQWVLDRACHQLKSWMADGVRIVPVAINVSAIQLKRRGFAERLMETLYGNSIDARWIRIEVTETAAMANVAEVAREMSILCALGCSFSIDDFGTGYSSLARLHQMPVSEVKIDRTFIERLCVPDGERSSLDIVRAIIAMAHSLGLSVVSEGVESEEQLECLAKLHCDLLQGYLLSRPVVPERIPDLLLQPAPRIAAIYGRGGSELDLPICLDQKPRMTGE